MFAYSQHRTPALLAGGGTALAISAVALLSFFPAARFIGLVLVALACGLFWASRLASKSPDGQVHWLRTPLDAPILLLLLQLVVSFWASALPEKSWVAIGQLGAGIVAFYTVVNWSRSRDQLWWTVGALIALGLGLALVAPIGVDWFSDRTLFLPRALYSSFRLLLSDSIHTNVMAAALAALIPLPVALLLALPEASRRHLWLRIALLVIIIVQISILILTQSRGGYIAFGVGLWLTLWLSGRRRWAIGLTLVAMLLAVWLVTRPPVGMDKELDPTEAALDASTWAFRQRVWQVAIQMIGDFPLTGVGIGTFNAVAEALYGFSAPKNPQAHNLFLQAALDLGLLGLVSLLAIFLLVIWAAVHAYGRFEASQEPILRAVAIGGLSGVVSIITDGLVDTGTWGSKGAFILWIVIGLLVALHNLALPRSPGAADRQEAPNL
jgi:putative inorganic carbon (HCO3(-)) transporter